MTNPRSADEKAAPNPAQSVHAESRTDSHGESKTAAPLACAGGAAVEVPPRGVEQPQKTTLYPSEKEVAPSGDAICDAQASRAYCRTVAPDERLAVLIAAWPLLTPDKQDMVLALVETCRASSLEAYPRLESYRDLA